MIPDFTTQGSILDSLLFSLNIWHLRDLLSFILLNAIYHQLNGHEFEQTPEDSEGQGSLVFCSPWGSQRAGHNLATEQQQQYF